MRVLFSSTSGLGHVLPMVPLAAAFRDRGHDLKWATADDARERLEAAEIPTVTAGQPMSERMADYGRRWPDALQQLSGPELADHMFPKLFGAVSAPTMLADLGVVVDAWRPDMIIHDAADFAAPLVAHELGVPNVTHGFGSIVPKERVSLAAAEAEALWAKVALEMPPYGGCYDHAYVDIHPPSLHVDDMGHLGRIVPLRPGSPGAGPDDVLSPRIAAALAGGRPVVYVTFGTVFVVSPAFSAAVSAASDLDAVVVVTVGPTGDADRFGPVPSNVHIERYIPQNLVLPHCSLVVSHGGSGTLLAAFAHGLPQVCLPQAADQFRNAASCASAGAGIALAGEGATEAAIGAALRRVLSEPEFRAGARKLQREIAAMPGPASVAETLEELTHP